MTRIAIFIFLIFLTPITVQSGSQVPSPYAAAVPPRPVQGDLPRNFADSMYKDALARLAFGQPESVIEPLLYLSRADPDLADLQSATAIALYLTHSNRHRRIVELSEHAVQLQPENPVFRVVRAIVDPSRSHQTPDGALLLTREAADQLGAAKGALEQGNPNMRTLAGFLGSVTNSQDPQYPYLLTRFDQLLESPGLLFTTPDTRSFGRVEDKIRARISDLAAEAKSAKGSADEAQLWFEKLQKEYQAASPSAKERLASESAEKRQEFDHWMSVATEKARRAEDEYQRLQALLSHDYPTLARLRIRDEPPEPPEIAESAIASANAGWVPEKRYALLIGNSQYGDTAKLKNPCTDARAIATMLHDQLHFTVNPLCELDQKQMVNAVRTFTAAVPDDAIVVVYYSGHGTEVAGENYLLPVNFQGKTEEDVEYDAYKLSRLLEALEGTRAKVKVVLLDACRNNPYRRTKSGASKGFAPPKLTELGTIVGYATQAGSTADDGDLNSSPYARALIREFAAPGASLQSALNEVIRTTVELTHNAQTPTQYQNGYVPTTYFGR